MERNANMYDATNTGQQAGDGMISAANTGRADAPLGATGGEQGAGTVGAGAATGAGVGTGGTGAGTGRIEQVKEKASQLKATLADKLEAGADRLRQRSAAGVTETGATAPQRTGKVTDKVAVGMQNTAEWVRNADLNSMRGGIENQVRTNPGRSLLVALGIGYLLGKVIRGGGTRQG